MRLLHLEDDSGDAELVRLVLRQGGLPDELRWVRDRASFERALEEEAFDIILADYAIAGYGGLAALAFVRVVAPSTPFIFVSGAIGEDRAIECLRLGARDYVLKERLSRLIPVIRRAQEEAENHRARRRSEAELEAARDRQRVLLEAACAAGVVPWAVLGERLSLGDSACALLGYTGLDLPMSLASLEALVHPDERRHAGRFFAHAAEGYPGLFECRVRKADSTYLWTRWTVRHRGPVASGIFQDVDEQHRLQEQLLQSQKMQSLGNLAARVAHDFANILHAMVGHAELLPGGGPLSAKQAGGVDAIRRAGERGMALIRQLRTFSHREAFPRKPTQLETLAREIRDLLAGGLESSISLEVEAAEESPWVLGDPLQLHEVVMNLVMNARDAVRERGGQIRVRVGTWRLSEGEAPFHRRPPGLYALLAVEDDGPGIPEEVRLHIFEPYFSTKGEKGMGLGLSVVCGIAEAHGGWLTCDSEPGEGTRFSVHLPLLEVNGVEEVRGNGTEG